MSEPDLPDWAQPSRQEEEASALTALAARMEQLAHVQQNLSDAMIALSHDQLRILQSLDQKQDRVIKAADRLDSAGTSAFAGLAETLAGHTWQQIGPVLNDLNRTVKDFSRLLGPGADMMEALRQARHDAYDAESRAVTRQAEVEAYMQSTFWKRITANWALPHPVHALGWLVVAATLFCLLVKFVIPTNRVCENLGGEIISVALPDQTTHRICNLGIIR